MKLKLLTSNSKLKKDGIFNFDIPAYKSSTGLITCPHARDCIANCYARQGTYVFSNVKAKHEANLQATLQDDFCENMIIEIIESKADIIRIHSAGDFYNREYISKWLKIIDSLPHIKFYAYTKSFAMFTGMQLPENFKMIQSQGGINPIDESKPHSKVFENESDIPEDYSKAIESDLNAVYKDKIALVYHGSKKHNGNAFINKKVA
jgi:hypothetical protein